MDAGAQRRRQCDRRVWNGTVNHTTCTPATRYADTDADGYGDPNSSTSDCNQPSGYVSDKTDCDDTDADAWPGADEYCDGHDDDCDGDTDEDDAVDASAWCYDFDGDGYGDANTTDVECISRATTSQTPPTATTRTATSGLVRTSTATDTTTTVMAM